MPATTFQFDPNAVAHVEVEGWKAYYDHAWPRLLRLIVQLGETQFRIPFPQSWLAAYHIARASAAWVPKDHDMAVIERHLAAFYKLALRSSGLHYDPQQAAALELRYWEEHRRLSGLPDKTSFIEALTALHAALFDLPPQEVRHSAEVRVAANNILDTITSHTSADPTGDWLRCEELLRESYGSIQAAIAAHPAK
jgi:hypothetical protein